MKISIDQLVNRVKVNMEELSDLRNAVVVLEVGVDVAQYIYGAQNETYIEGWEKKTSNLLIYKRLCNV